MYILLAILLFGLLVAIHEFGHFITAKMSGVRVNEFSIGMGPAIFTTKNKQNRKSETVYSLRLLPFGGYCAMEGEDGESEDPRAFGACPVLKRILIVLAGSFMNLLMGFIVLFFVFLPDSKWDIPIVDNIVTEEKTVVPEGMLDDNMLHPGDEIISVNGYDVYIARDIGVGFSRDNGDGIHNIRVIRDGKEKLITGLGTATNEVAKESPEANAGNNGYRIVLKKENASFFGRLKYTAQNGVNLVRLVFVGVGDLLSGSVSKDEISGPIGIGKVMAETAEEDMPSLWFLFAFISINLGIMNLLPLPALDGGRFIFLLIELIFRKKVPPKYEAIVHGIGLILLLGLMAFVTFNDVINIF